MCCHLFGIIGKRKIYNAFTMLCLYMKTIEIEDDIFFHQEVIWFSMFQYSCETCADVLILTDRFLFMCSIFFRNGFFFMLCRSTSGTTMCP